MSKEAYVKFETAKLLKEKGFDGHCHMVNINNHNSLIGKVISNSELTTTREYKFCRDKENCITIPTQQMAMRWFWEEKGLNINAIYGDYPSMKKAYWMPQIDSLKGCYGIDDENFFREYNSREDCIEAALEYALRNLI